MVNNYRLENEYTAQVGALKAKTDKYGETIEFLETEVTVTKE